MKPSLTEILFQVLSIKNNKHEEAIFLYPSILKVEVRCELILCLSTQVSYLWTINSPNIVQITSNWAQGCTVTHVKWCLHHAMPIWFVFVSRKSCNNSNLGVHLWSICMYLPKSILASCKKMYGLMTHYIVTKTPFEQT